MALPLLPNALGDILKEVDLTEDKNALKLPPDWPMLRINSTKVLPQTYIFKNGYNHVRIDRFAATMFYLAFDPDPYQLQSLQTQYHVDGESELF